MNTENRYGSHHVADTSHDFPGVSPTESASADPIAWRRIWHRIPGCEHILGSIPVIIAIWGVLVGIRWIREEDSGTILSRYQQEASTQVLASDAEKALVCYQRLVQSERARPAFRLAMARALESIGQTRRAEAIYAQLGAEQSDDPEILSHRAARMLADHQLEDAQKFALQAVLRVPNHEKSRLILAQIALLNNRPKSAIDHLNQITKLSPDLFLLKARMEYLQGLNDAAKDSALSVTRIFRRNAEANPRDHNARFAWSETELLQDNFPAAFQILQHGWERSQNAEYLSQMADVLAIWGEHIAQEIVAKNSRPLTTTTPSPSSSNSSTSSSSNSDLYPSALAFPSSGGNPKTAQPPQEKTSGKRSYPLAADAQGVALAMKERFSLLEQGLRLDPRLPALLIQFRDLVPRPGPNGDAQREALIKMLTVGQSLALTHTFLGVDAAQLSVGRLTDRKAMLKSRDREGFASALVHFRQAEQEWPQLAFLVNNLAWAVTAAEPSQPELGLILADAAQTLRPNEPGFRANRARILIALDQWDEAFLELQSVATPLDREPEFHKAMAAILQQRAQPELAAKHAQIAQKLIRTTNPNPKSANPNINNNKNNNTNTHSDQLIKRTLISALTMPVAVSPKIFAQTGVTLPAAPGLRRNLGPGPGPESRDIPNAGPAQTPTVPQRDLPESPNGLLPNPPSSGNPTP